MTSIASTLRQHGYVTRRAEYLADAVAELRALAEAQLAPLIVHVTARAARLQLREERLAAGRPGRAAAMIDAPPIEVDRGRRAPAGELASDDSVQRFALLELDGAAAPA